MQHSSRIWRCETCTTLIFHLDTKTLKLASVPIRLISAAETRPWTLRSKTSTLSWLSDGGAGGVWLVALMPIARKGRNMEPLSFFLGRPSLLVELEEGTAMVIPRQH
jgi:hypothetical protein